MGAAGKAAASCLHTVSQTSATLRCLLQFPIWYTNHCHSCATVLTSYRNPRLYWHQYNLVAVLKNEAIVTKSVCKQVPNFQRLTHHCGRDIYDVKKTSLPNSRRMSHDDTNITVFFLGSWPPLYGVSRAHSDTTHLVGLLWSSDQPVAETSNWQYITLTRDIQPCHRRDSNDRRSTR